MAIAAFFLSTFLNTFFVLSKCQLTCYIFLKRLELFQFGLRTPNEYLIKSSIFAIRVKRQLNPIQTTDTLSGRNRCPAESIDTRPASG
jgi:hypothetical protein